jgi:hypothetical protein
MPHKLAEGAGKFIIQSLKPKKNVTPLDDDTFYFLGKWAGHWARIALGESCQ